MKKIRQFRYYGSDATALNFPSGINRDTLKTGQIFKEEIDLRSSTIVALGIQTLPGLQVNLNGAHHPPIIIGSSGIYELSLSNGYEINNLAFPDASLNLIDSNPNAYLIIDLIYNDAEE